MQRRMKINRRIQWWWCNRRRKMRMRRSWDRSWRKRCMRTIHPSGIWKSDERLALNGGSRRTCAAVDQWAAEGIWCRRPRPTLVGPLIETKGSRTGYLTDLDTQWSKKTGPKREEEEQEDRQKCVLVSSPGCLHKYISLPVCISVWLTLCLCVSLFVCLHVPLHTRPDNCLSSSL